MPVLRGNRPSLLFQMIHLDTTSRIKKCMQTSNYAVSSQFVIELSRILGLVLDIIASYPLQNVEPGCSLMFA
jgi:hypothetical protein